MFNPTAVTADAFGDHDATEEQRKASLGTTDYVRNKANPGIAITVECGHHYNADNVAIGCTVITRAMHFAGLIDGDVLPSVPTGDQHAIQMQRVFYKQKSGALVKPWHHCDQVAAGELIARYDDGEGIAAPQDGVIVLPKTQTDHAIGAEWFYFGVETDFPES